MNRTSQIESVCRKCTDQYVSHQKAVTTMKNFIKSAGVDNVETLLKQFDVSERGYVTRTDFVTLLKVSLCISYNVLKLEETEN